MPEIVGYCRVSTDGQTLDAQVAELKAAGATKLFAEKQSGARSDRPQLRKALAALGEGGVLMVTRLDRLARSTRDLLNVLHEVAQGGAAFMNTSRSPRAASALRSCSRSDRAPLCFSANSLVAPWRSCGARDRLTSGLSRCNADR